MHALIRSSLVFAAAGSMGWIRTEAMDPSEVWQIPIRFTHPMTVTNPEELTLVKERIALQVEPQFSAWLQLQVAADEALDFVPDPPAEISLIGGYDPRDPDPSGRELWRSARAAYTCALAWALTGQDRYGAKAAEVLNAWAAKDTVFLGKNRGLKLGSDFTPMLYAVDLLWDFDGWLPADRRGFEEFWRKRCLVYTEFVMLRANNWGDNALMGVLAAAIVFEDEALTRRCLARLNDYFFGDWKIRIDARGTFLPHEVGRNDGRSGISYTAYSLQAITQLLEMARNFGPAFDWWEQSTTKTGDAMTFEDWTTRDPKWKYSHTGGATIRGLVEDFFRWNVLNERFPWYEENFSEGEPKRRTDRMNTLETAHTRLELSPRIGAWLEANRPMDGSTADPYCTLLKGDL